MQIKKSQSAKALLPQAFKPRVQNPRYSAKKMFTLKDFEREVIKHVGKLPREEPKPVEVLDTQEASEDEIASEEAPEEFTGYEAIMDDYINAVVGEGLQDSKLYAEEAEQEDDNGLNDQDTASEECNANAKSEDSEKNDAKAPLTAFEARAKQYEEKRKAKQQKLEKEAMSKCSFKPQINKKSAKLDQQKSSTQRIVRQQSLYELNKVRKVRKEELKETVEAERFEKYGAKEAQECTFKPKINSKKVPAEVADKKMLERTDAWQTKKLEKMLKIIEDRKEKESASCTFKPKINKNA